MISKATMLYGAFALVGLLLALLLIVKLSGDMFKSVDATLDDPAVQAVEQPATAPQPEPAAAPRDKALDGARACLERAGASAEALQACLSR